MTPEKEVVSSRYPYAKKMRRDEYEASKEKLQVELLKLQNWVVDSGQRIIILFEGRDAAGKGGTIKRFMEHLNPRGCRIVALAKPTEREQGEWYFQRYVRHLPTKGEMVLFDRSWYNRAVVEPVMGFCTQEQHQDFLRDAATFESMLIDDGFILFKFWFSVSREEQLRRFISREADTLKHWKLSPVDMESLAHWDDYTLAKTLMFSKTDTRTAPWTVVRSDCKKRARLNCMKFVLSNCDYTDKPKDAFYHFDPQIVGLTSVVYNSRELGGE
ncbi:MAG: polyphosphate kinase 2 [Verrucomicrobiota bacterium]